MLLHDFSVVVIGSNKKVIASGPRAGLLTSETDSAEERSKKWSRFQGGEYDVALVTYSVFTRTRMSPEDIERYVAKTASMQRLITLRKRNAGKRGRKKEDISERADAVLEEGSWPSGWPPCSSSPKTSGTTPASCGTSSASTSSSSTKRRTSRTSTCRSRAREGCRSSWAIQAPAAARAWQLDFRTATVRAKTGGAGVVLLSATPAKNSPLEFYNLIQYVDHDAFARIGVRNPEEFIDRYCKVEIRPVIGPSGRWSAAERSPASRTCTSCGRSSSGTATSRRPSRSSCRSPEGKPIRRSGRAQ
ncbi:MAG: hypothetical protein IPG17_27765 [Sandaracinaceae bacterium]|nr:hypothetical protein [Sandaracinaceae bacterium]